MPGKYNKEWYLAGAEIKLKPARMGLCSCGRESLRERYTPGKGWEWLCYRCAPDPRVERRYAPGHKPMGYVPKSYTSDGELTHADRIAAKLKTGDFVAKNFDGTINDGWRPKRAAIS